jgi:hypothetical protein
MRDAYARNFLLDMADVGQWLLAYRSAPDKAVALQTLAGHFTVQKKDQELEALLREHGPDPPGESQLNAAWYRFYQGELHELRGEYQHAEKDFAAALAKAGQPQQWSFRNALFRARVRTGQAVRTYQENETTTRVFEELANLCVAEKATKELAALLAAHRQAHPAFRHARAWELDVKWLEKDYAGAYQILTENPQGLLAQPRFRWKAENYLIRCLVRLKKTKEAIEKPKPLLKRARATRFF